MDTKNLTLPNDVQEVPKLAAFVDEICEAVGIDMSSAMKMNLAIEEAVVNVMNYAYPSGTKGEVRIEAKAHEGYVEFVISDDGKPFNPTEVKDADTTLSVEERDIGGLGIFLVKHYMDKVKYKYVDGQNVLTLRKNLK
ncbi:MAG: ATP-binding protein [Prevotella sp.]|jgi:sigma-B regulation protein RsbU (phosphoserine phosphatase)|nr:ATP-binding protein [Prevotella sp.]MBO7538938.1 ATP-binding protein [Prevotella sp.]